MTMDSLAPPNMTSSVEAGTMKLAEKVSEGHTLEAKTAVAVGDGLELTNTSVLTDAVGNTETSDHSNDAGRSVPVDDDETESEDDRTSRAILQTQRPRAIVETEDEAQQKAREDVEQFIQSVMRSDRFIIDSAEQLGIANDGALMVDPEHGTVSFVLCDNLYKDWREAHERHTQTKFTQTKAPYTLKQGFKDGWSRHEHICHRGKPPTLHPERVKGGKTGKPRKARQWTYCGCKSFLQAYRKQREVRRSDGTTEMVWVYDILYMFRHNHPLGQNNGVGIRRLSPEMKEQIRMLAQNGLSVQAIHAQLNREVKARRPAMLWDDHVYYMDVYNIVYKANPNKSRKDT
ncbi:hypothetical protein DFQ27_005924 [Actinomortierella ambigua]|uniref:Uncharacterized protein n=1 Tax=Actinomortierella ambigua TaxID=1343610 RepID=A0A9P6U1W4_9FUNG|nr:hypothetical protein DFQ27_005924 [Actinomortierella ambigua]